MHIVFANLGLTGYAGVSFMRFHNIPSTFVHKVEVQKSLGG